MYNPKNKNMAIYELMTIAKVSLGEDGARKVSNDVKDLISSLNGKVLNSDFWGKRKLAYEIKHDTEAFYEVMTFDSDGSVLSKLKSKMNLLEGLVRYLITAKE